MSKRLDAACGVGLAAAVIAFGFMGGFHMIVAGYRIQIALDTPIIGYPVLIGLLMGVCYYAIRGDK